MPNMSNKNGEFDLSKSVPKDVRSNPSRTAARVERSNVSRRASGPSGGLNKELTRIMNGKNF
jgi:hypothetical protein